MLEAYPVFNGKLHIKSVFMNNKPEEFYNGILCPYENDKKIMVAHDKYSYNRIASMYFVKTNDIFYFRIRI